MKDIRMKTVLTYGTFDLFHIGHVKMLQRLSELGDRLIVGVSTDAFNEIKGKQALFPYNQRAEIVSSNRYVDLVIPENSWEQKIEDIKKYDVDVFAIGEDWQGKFDFLQEYCEVQYLPRTEDISSSLVREVLKGINSTQIEQIRAALDILQRVVKDLS
jgi:glycerol-3-phosphate cytidylyltransferase